MRIWATAAAAILALVAGCGGDAPRKQKAPKPKAKSAQAWYALSGSRTSNNVSLWSDAERSESKPKHKIPDGTKVTIIKRDEQPKSRGSTMCLVRAVTGEEGWIPEKFLEQRDE